MPDDPVSVEVLAAPSPRDAEAIARLIAHLSSARPPDLAELRDLVSSPTVTMFVARSGDAIVGTLSLAIFAVPTGRRAWIEDVVVDPRFQRRGIASRLVAAALGLATDAGCRTVDLTSRPSRQDANRLYERLGFVRRETNVYRISLGS